MINFLVDWQDVGNGALAALRMLLLKICEPVYGLIIFCFDIFEDFGKVRLFAESDTISLIYTRVGLILGLFMVFRLTFAAIEYLINPDKMMDSKSGIGNIVKKVLIVVILLGSTRYLFDFAFNLQDKLIDSNIIGNLILGPSYDESEKNSSGTQLAWYAFTQFYKLNKEVVEKGGQTDNNYSNCSTMLGEEENGEYITSGSIYTNFSEKHELKNAEYCLNLQTEEKYTINNEASNSDTDNLNIIDFNGFLCLTVGLCLLWTIMVYTIQVAIRVFQLAYLELIAPIPIMMYLMPNGDEKLKKWGQQCLTTFLDFFIRLAIMNFIILVSNALIELTSESNTLKNFGELSAWGVGYITIMLIIALFMFAKKAPELLKEIFPSSGGAAGLGFGIKSPKEVWGDMKSTPILGMGAKAIGYAGNNLVKKPIENKIAEKAELKKVKKQANKDIHERKALENKGRDLYNTHGGTLPDTVFKSKEYRASYNRVSEAKGAARDAEDNLHSADLAYQAAYNSGDATAIARTKAAREAALKENRAAQARLEATKQDHENIKKIYAEDAKIENAHKYYKDLHPNGEPQPPRPMSLEEAARISTDNNASDEDQQRAAEVLDEARRQRNSNNNNNNNN